MTLMRPSTRRAFVSAAIVATIIAPTIAHAQSPSSRDALVASARAGTTRYQSVDAAIADGFKRVGAEFPAMGEHWVNLPRVLENRFDPARPSVLIYITTNGKRRLAGVGYTALLDDGQQPPRSAANASDWHEHNGSVIDESLPMHHDGAHDASAPPGAADLGSPRLAILHVWAWTPNAAGPFVTENWALPLVRRGIDPRRALSADAIRAISLADDHSAYYEQTLRTALGLSDAECARIEPIVDRQRRAALAAIARDPRFDDAMLAASWRALWVSLERELPERSADLRALRSKL